MRNIFAWLSRPISAYAPSQSGTFSPHEQPNDETIRHYPVNYYPGVPVKLTRYDRRRINPLMAVTQNGNARQV